MTPHPGMKIPKFVKITLSLLLFSVPPSSVPPPADPACTQRRYYWSSRRARRTLRAASFAQINAVLTYIYTTPILYLPAALLVDTPTPNRRWNVKWWLMLWWVCFYIPVFPPWFWVKLLVYLCAILVGECVCMKIDKFRGKRELRVFRAKLPSQDQCTTLNHKPTFHPNKQWSFWFHQLLCLFFYLSTLEFLVMHAIIS